ncbi:MAG: translation initiation factor IF-2, partial [Candidatus Paceibacteria bacterium]
MQKDVAENLISRPPIVVVMGHVDHGKTSLLDFIRNTKVAEKEAGGITQRIGAYEVVHAGKQITFIDTPGHEAFSRMRERGAKVADVAILVVAGDESVKLQTKEALSHIKTADIPFVVAITKIDKPSSNPDKVKQDLSKEGVLVEDWGGKVPVALVSSKTGEGINELLDLVLLVAEMEELKADPNAPAKGVVIESHLDPRRGPTATLLILDGTLKVGDQIIAGCAACKVKILENFLGQKITKASFSSPVLVLGWEGIPQVGEEFKVGKEPEKIARIEPKKPEVVAQEEQTKFILILKADVSGSLEALEESVRRIAKEQEVDIKILQCALGEINESDIKLADTGKAEIVAFRVGVSQQARAFAQA